MAFEADIGVVIPAYQPDLQRLNEYVEDLYQVLDPSVVRVEIDDPPPRYINSLRQNTDTVGVSADRRGKGGAIMSGFDTLDTDILLFADADGSTPATSLVDIAQQVHDGTSDVSIGSRRHPSSQIVKHQTVIRRILGDGFAFVARQLLPTRCHDYQCGAKAVSAEAWEEIRHHCYEPGFAWDLEFVSVAGSLGYDIVEVPIKWDDHPNSTVDPLATSVELLTALIDVRRRTKAIANSPQYRNIQRTERSEMS